MSQPGGSTWVADSLNESSIFNGRLVYDKGGAIIHTLRYIINNDEMFFDLLKAFQVEFANSTATGLEFKAFAENFTGMDFTNFFEEWYFGEGYPTYAVQYNGIGTNVNVMISQTTSAPTSISLFTNPIDLRITRSGGLGDTIVRIPISTQQTYFTISGIENFQAVVGIDPLNYIINKSNGITQNPSLSVSTVEAEKSTMLYPNPTEGQLTVVFSDLQPRTIRVIDQKGKIAIEQQIGSSQVIDLSALKTGQYLVELTDGKNNSTTRKVIKR